MLTPHLSPLLFTSPPALVPQPTSYTTPHHNPRNPSANSYKLPDQARILAHPKHPRGDHYCLNLGLGPKRGPAFKPRKVKKSAEKYRNRAEERRVGADHDYSQIEAVLEDFERRNADEDQAKVEEQRRFLGGDSDHSILVKGLDYALLEQNKARLATVNSKVDDESLEAAFLETSTSTTTNTTTTGQGQGGEGGKKRSRADLIRELKEKRGGDGEGSGSGSGSGGEGKLGSGNGNGKGKVKGKGKVVEDKPIPEGKFKPIGFKPIGKTAGEEKGRKKKKVRVDDGGDAERKRKKRKVVDEERGEEKGSATVSTKESSPEQPRGKTLQEPEPEPADEDFDIFADAGEYQGLELEDDEGEDEEEKADEEKLGEDTSTTPGPARRRGWFEDDEPEPEPEAGPSKPAEPQATKSRSKSPTNQPEMEEEDAEEGELMRLAPLESSALPSIKDFLAADEAAEKDEKRRARKDKKKKGKGPGGEGGDKIERDYQR
ncbi:uncharacterized protein STEHIDRAFT_135293 [Stereum hirsutum FP-91666 SS1]|uniref:RED-like N-terminal domain-containing protein n=1 Tax=Stereum hirsutum (strain FP-91666) TaxID=721885 RepID=R7RYC9_STEHR|nr:uncharacterized protein STEHIDRAFT_135293 [Stereum hirsutum FP-91666 SS1]EIM80411.1 hypothetical protein STEHIDRAFT_135293 [Stereum hirsutum FP-91666 SS1]